MGLLNFIKINIRISRNRRYVKAVYPNVYYFIEGLIEKTNAKNKSSVKRNYNKNKRKKKFKGKLSFLNKIFYVTNYSIDDDERRDKQIVISVQKDLILVEVLKLREAYLTVLKLKNKNEINNILSLYNSNLNTEAISAIMNILDDDELIYELSSTAGSKFVTESIVALASDLLKCMNTIKNSNVLGQKLSKQDELNSYLKDIRNGTALSQSNDQEIYKKREQPVNQSEKTITPEMKEKFAKDDELFDKIANGEYKFK